ncbi:TPA: hypothetical protein I7738_21565 [Vibrio vulnificus]|nr:hypothetical protein [Vibrio vulnificus]
MLLFFSASWHCWTLFSGHLFFGARNSESCLIEFLSKLEVRKFSSVSTRQLFRFLFSRFKFNLL